MMQFHRRIFAYAFAGICALLLGCASPQEDQGWPDKVVGIKDMHPTQRIHTSMLLNRMENKSPAATVVLKLHVNESGDVVRTAVFESSGLPKVDGAAQGAMRKMTFRPYTVGGVATPVTVIAPMHFPAVN